MAVQLSFLFIVFLLVVGLLAGLVALLVNRRTRRAAVALLPLLPLTILVLSVVSVWLIRPAHVTHIQQFGTRNNVPHPVEVLQDKHQEDAVVPSVQLAESPPPASDRPAWIDQPADRDGEGNYVIPIAVGPYTTRVECDRDLPVELNKAIDQYVAMAVGPEARGKIGLPPAYVQEHVVRARWKSGAITSRPWTGC